MNIDKTQIVDVIQDRRGVYVEATLENIARIAYDSALDFATKTPGFFLLEGVYIPISESIKIKRREE